MFIGNIIVVNQYNTVDFTSRLMKFWNMIDHVFFYHHCQYRHTFKECIHHVQGNLSKFTVIQHLTNKCTQT